MAKTPLNARIHVCRTLRSNHKEVPTVVKKIEILLNSKKGDSVAYSSDEVYSNEMYSYAFLEKWTSAVFRSDAWKKCLTPIVSISCDTWRVYIHGYLFCCSTDFQTCYYCNTNTSPKLSMYYDGNKQRCTHFTVNRAIGLHIFNLCPDLLQIRQRHSDLWFDVHPENYALIFCTQCLYWWGASVAALIIALSF